MDQKLWTMAPGMEVILSFPGWKIIGYDLAPNMLIEKDSRKNPGKLLGKGVNLKH